MTQPNTRRRTRTTQRGVIIGTAALLAVVGLGPKLAGSGAQNPPPDTTLGTLAATTDFAAARTPSPTTTQPTTTQPTTPPTTTPPLRPMFELSAAEVAPEAKQLATDAAVALTTYDPDTDFETLVAALFPFDARSEAALLHHPGSWSRGLVIYPQLGGLTRDRASVMVVVHQEVGVGDRTTLEVIRTLDIRLIKTGDEWALESLASAGGETASAPPVLSAEARAVLENPRIRIADSGRWDIYRGEVSNDLLTVLLEISDRTEIGVTVLSSGHPFHVFGTERQSAHTAGRAADVYLVGDSHVIDDRTEGSLTIDLVAWLLQHPLVRQVGSPWDIDGKPSRSFTDTVHQDHIHIAVHH